MPGLRIMAGSARGRRLKLPDPAYGVRPILARIKKSLFDIIRDRIPASAFLDLYAGAGSVGLEAASRGAGRVVLVEKEKNCAAIIASNIKNLGFEGRAKVVNSSVELFIERAEERYDIIFMGPPYKNQSGMLFLSMPALAEIYKKNILSEKGVIIVQHHKREVLADTGGLVIYRTEKYGDSNLTFYSL